MKKIIGIVIVALLAGVFIAYPTNRPTANLTVKAADSTSTPQPTNTELTPTTTSSPPTSAAPSPVKATDPPRVTQQSPATTSPTSQPTTQAPTPITVVKSSPTNNSASLNPDGKTGTYSQTCELTYSDGSTAEAETNGALPQPANVCDQFIGQTK